MIVPATDQNESISRGPVLWDKYEPEASTEKEGGPYTLTGRESDRPGRLSTPDKVEGAVLLLHSSVDCLMRLLPTMDRTSKTMDGQYNDG